MIIKNGRVLSEGGFKDNDIKIEDGIITEIRADIVAKKDEDVIDASGRFVLPGLIDIHTHLDDNIGSFKIADDFYTGSLIAAKNGITTIYNFITERPDRPLKIAIREFFNKGRRSLVNYAFHLTPITFGKTELDYIKRLIETGFNSFKFYTTYKNAGIYLDYEAIERFANEVATEETTILVHCEDEEVLNNFYCYDYQKPFDHYLYRPKEAEVEAVKKIIEISKSTKKRFHIVHCSTYESAELINKAKKDSKITYETCPQYLLLSNNLLKEKNGHRYFCTPPFRDRVDVNRLKEMAIDGYFDIFTTDHAPFTKTDKDKNRDSLRNVPNGLPGLGALSHTIYNILKTDSDLFLVEFVRRLSENPAKILNLFPQKGIIREGSDADLIIISEQKKPETVIPTLADSYNPYKNFYSILSFDYVIINGVVVVKDREIINKNHRGRCLNVRREGIPQ